MPVPVQLRRRVLLLLVVGVIRLKLLPLLLLVLLVLLHQLLVELRSVLLHLPVQLLLPLLSSREAQLLLLLLLVVVRGRQATATQPQRAAPIRRAGCIAAPVSTGRPMVCKGRPQLVLVLVVVLLLHGQLAIVGRSTKC